MSDEALRELEREARSGDVAARARLLTERVRRGLEPDRVRLAAFLGDEAALEVARAFGLRVAPPAETLEAWFGRIEGHGLEAGVRLALVLARLLLPLWEDEPLGCSPRKAFAVVEEAVACPCALHAAAAVDAQAEAERAHDGVDEARWDDAGALLALAGARATAWAARVAAARADVEAADLRLVGAWHQIGFVLVEPAHEPLRALACAALEPWSLGASTAPMCLDSTGFLLDLIDRVETALVVTFERRSWDEAARRVHVAAIRGLLPRVRSGTYAAFVAPTFTPRFRLELVLGEEDTIAVHGFEGREDEEIVYAAIYDARHRRVAPPLVLPASWCLRRPLGAERGASLRSRMAAIRPELLHDRPVDPSSRDGTSFAGEVTLDQGEPWTFHATNPGAAGADRHAAYFNALLEAARSVFEDEPRATALLRNYEA